MYELIYANDGNDFANKKSQKSWRPHLLLTKHSEHAGGLSQLVLTDAVVASVVVRIDFGNVELHAGLKAKHKLRQTLPPMYVVVCTHPVLASFDDGDAVLVAVLQKTPVRPFPVPEGVGESLHFALETSRRVAVRRDGLPVDANQRRDCSKNRF